MKSVAGHLNFGEFLRALLIPHSELVFLTSLYKLTPIHFSQKSILQPQIEKKKKVRRRQKRIQKEIQRECFIL